ncbi:MAG: hypothetical protein ABH818_00215 [Patescibacteria group bacterium]|nr:hypothetical protein [Patescibacteria group bacterium]
MSTGTTKTTTEIKRPMTLKMMAMQKKISPEALVKQYLLRGTKNLAASIGRELNINDYLLRQDSILFYQGKNEPHHTNIWLRLNEKQMNIHFSNKALFRILQHATPGKIQFKKIDKNNNYNKIDSTEIVMTLNNIWTKIFMGKFYHATNALNIRINHKTLTLIILEHEINQSN